MAGEQHQERDAERGKGAGHFVLWVSFVLVVYVLSIGPAAWLHQKTTSPGVKTTLYTVYAPVVLLMNKTPLKPVGAWWVYEWVDVPESRTWLHPE